MSSASPPVPFLDLTEQYAPLRDEIEDAIERVVESQYFILGPEVEALEAEVTEYLESGARERRSGTDEAEPAAGEAEPGAGEAEPGADEAEPAAASGSEGVASRLHAIGCASGTDALLLPLMALRESDESQPGRSASPAGSNAASEAAPNGDVVLPAFTFFATAGAVWNAGFRPVFCDVDPETFNVTGETVEAAWTEATRAVIPVHLFGQMAPMEEITTLAHEGDALVFEDAAQAIGAHRNGRSAGTVGDCGAFSFFPTKNLGGFGDGGMITTRDPGLAELLAKLRVHGGRQMYHHEMVGTNSRLDALQAAVLRVKLPHLDRWAARRRDNARIYDELLADVDGVRIPVTAEGNLHTYNQYTLRVEKRDDLREFLSDRQIGNGLYYPVPLHLQECFRGLGYEKGDLPVSEELCARVVSLPIFPELGRERIEIVADAIRTFYGA